MNTHSSDNIAMQRIRKTKHISKYLTPETMRQVVRYLVTGFSSAAIEFTLLYIFKDAAHMSVLLSNTAALSIVFWFNFLMNRFWSFKSRMKLGKQLSMYLVLYLVNLGASDLIMYLLTDQLSMQYMLAKVFAIGAVVSWNFIIYKKVIYK